MSGKLDYEVLQQAESYINVIGERELNLRGLKLLKIENLILTKDQNECIDFSENDIIRLATFPLMKNLKTLLMGGNRICKIESDLASYLPSLSTLILTSNMIENLSDLTPIFSFPNLKELCLVNNPVTEKEHYRLYVIHKSSSNLRILDFRKVKESERNEAAELFSGADGTALAHALATPPTNGTTQEDDASLDQKSLAAKKRKMQSTVGPSLEEQKRIREAIKNAKTLDEIAALEQQLEGGVVPGR